MIFGSAGIGGLVDLAARPPDLLVIGADLDDELGASLAGGDINGDGVDDLIIGAPHAAAAGNTKAEAGEAYVVFGSPTLGGTLDLASTSPDITILGAESLNRLGRAVAAGDLNGDGVADLMVGAPGSLDAVCANNRVFVLFGASNFAASSTSPAVARI